MVRGRSKSSHKLTAKRRKFRARSLPAQDAYKHEEPVETLGYPIKSPLDPKSYKVIRLKNGLRAILISDCSVANEIIYPTDENGVDHRVLEFNKEILHIDQNKRDEPMDCDYDATKFTDQNDYQTRCCTEGRKYGRASICLSVGTGSFNDPKEYLGMAHFCEHMVFLASEKYPTPGEFEMFLANNGGDCNGITGGDRTRFFLSMKYNEEALTEALDRFSDMFISPIMTLPYVQKERQIVDSEFQDKRNGEYDKRVSILQTCGKPDHPVCQFSWGNMKTLQPPDGNDATLLAAVRKFHRETYSAEHMTLAIELPEPVRVIERLVADYFSGIPNKGIPQLSLQDRLLPFDTNRFRKFYYVASKRDTEWLHITWELPQEPLEDYMLRPLEYLGTILGSSKVGTLGCYLRERYLISNISSRPGLAECENTECSILFNIYFQLTKFGMRNVSMILDATFAYIKFLKRSEPQKRVFDEGQIMQAIHLHYHQENVPADLDDGLRYFPPEHIILSNSIPLAWNPAKVKQYLRLLIPSTANFMLTSKHFDFCKKREPHFKTRFHVTDVPQKLIRRLETVSIYSFFKPVLENRFIPTDFKSVTLPSSRNESTHPCLVVRSQSLEFWHFVGSTAGVFANYYLALMSPDSMNCIQSAVVLDILVMILNRSSNRSLSGASDAGTHYDIVAIEEGILAIAHGFPQRLDLIMDCILHLLFYDKVWGVCDNFNAARDILNVRYFNSLLTPESLNGQLQGRLCTNNSWTTKEKQEILTSLTFEEFQTHAEKYIKRFDIIGFTEGNMSAKTAKEFANKILHKKRCHGFEEEIIYKKFVNQIPLGETILRVRNMNKRCNATFVSNLYQIGLENKFTPILCEYFSNAMASTAFQQLREVEKLGYLVLVDSRPLSSANGICVSVCTQSDRFSANHIMWRINMFMEDFYHEHVENMTTEEFRGMTPYHGFHTDHSAFTQWKHIMNKDLNFLQGTEQCKMAREEITIEDVKSWYQKYLLNPKYCTETESSEFRLLSVQVVGVADNEFKRIVELGHGLTSPIRRRPGHSLSAYRDTRNPMKILLPNRTHKVTRKKCVVDIPGFIRSLKTYPEESSNDE